MKILMFTFSVLFSFSTFAQIKNLVFEGAGMRGLAYAGVVEELEAQGILEGVEKVGGTSAGAITALMIALNYNSNEIQKILSDTEFQNFNDGGLGGISRIKNEFGWYKGEEFEKWIENIIEAKTGDAGIMFNELDAGGFKDLYVVVTSLNGQKLKVLSEDNYPNMKVKDAVRASMSIPLYFRAVFVDEHGHRYNDYKDGLDVLIDGGIMGNYPIFIFDEIVNSNTSNLRIANAHTLGFRIDSKDQILQDSITRQIAPFEINSIQDYVSALYNFTMESANRNQLTEADWDRTVSISSEGIGPVIRKFSQQEKELLVQSGRNSIKQYLQENHQANIK
jgi:NTE family protein